MAWRDRLNKLSSWQRLWLVGSALWLLALVIVGVNVTYEVYVCSPDYIRQVPWDDSEYVRYPGASLKTQNDVDLLYKMAGYCVDERYIGSRWSEVPPSALQATEITFHGPTLSFYLLYGVLPVIGAYPLGIAIAWIIKGFKKRSQNCDG